MSTIEREDHHLGGAADQAPLDRAVMDALASMASTDEPLTHQTLLVEVNIDSLDLIELTQLLDDEHSLSIPPNAFAEVTSVGDVLETVRSCLS
jgi:acyl carrier protein